MAKKQKKAERLGTTDEPVLPQPKNLTEEDRIKAAEKMNKLSGSEVLTLPDDAVITIPISGFFKRSIEGVMFHLMEDLNATEIIDVMNNIKTDFAKKDPDKVTNRDKALWCIMTLLSEITWQSDAQGKNVVTEQTVGNSISKVLTGATGATEALGQAVQVTKEKAEEKKSNEGSDQ